MSASTHTPAGHHASPVVAGQRGPQTAGVGVPPTVDAGGRPTNGWTRNVDCSHAVCVGSSCMYVPQVPTIGPDLPLQIRDQHGDLWTRYPVAGGGYGKLYYAIDHRIAAWSEICGWRWSGTRWPGGPWDVVGVSHDDGWGWAPLTLKQALERVDANAWRFR